MRRASFSLLEAVVALAVVAAGALPVLTAAARVAAVRGAYRSSGGAHTAASNAAAYAAWCEMRGVPADAPWDGVPAFAAVAHPDGYATVGEGPDATAYLIRSGGQP